MSKSRQIAFLGIFFAMTIALAFIENSLPPIPFFPPGVKLGLSNIVVMYCLFFVGKMQAVTIAVLKSAFVFLTRSIVAGTLSFFGGIVSVLVMALIILTLRQKTSYFTLSIFGAVFHNIGQFIALSIFFGSHFNSYFPILILSGILSGIATATILKFIMPVLDNLT